MFLSWTTLVFLIVAAAIAWFWQDSLAARERANAAAIEACERLGLQFLDGTVAFARLGWTRGASGRLTLRRTYVFDYTATSIDRLQGFVVLSGHRVETVGYAPGQTDQRPRLQPMAQEPRPVAPSALTNSLADPQTNSQANSQTNNPANPSNVLDLDQWRTQHRPPLTPRRENREESGDPRH
ncbi:hypothetical protein HNQ60_003502 [Povalibacter uvarum]|uniref:DUF3301 domain-containing protein n=1 Tax=Povalibacter uvarum TaxID=732238 RepID=A0A841HRV1_9GAMM|nr:DUF3301 domain-containing protein [Povalibacter uvarum]MBB6094615.1 hypothetical protein [Povalibacter uvarum]